MKKKISTNFKYEALISQTKLNDRFGRGKVKKKGCVYDNKWRKQNQLV